LGADGARLDDLIGRLGSLVGVVGTGPVVSLHGDCKLDHLHRGGSVMHLIDIDNAGPGDAALDLGNLLADVRWWARRAPREIVDASVRAVVVAYGPLASAPSIDLVEALSLLRITARRTRPDQADWIAQTTAGIVEVEHLVERLELRLGC
jgi:aminoglycoside phosphotransferase (APT) family kinase protein